MSRFNLLKILEHCATLLWHISVIIVIVLAWATLKRLTRIGVSTIGSSLWSFENWAARIVRLLLDISGSRISDALVLDTVLREHILQVLLLRMVTIGLTIRMIILLRRHIYCDKI